MHIKHELPGDEGCLTQPFIPSTMPRAWWVCNRCSVKEQVAIPAKEWSLAPLALPLSPRPQPLTDFSKALARDSPEEPTHANQDYAFISPADIWATSKTNTSCTKRTRNAKRTRGRSGSFGDASRPLPLAPHPLYPLHLLNIQDMALCGWQGKRLGARDRSRAASIRLFPGPAAEKPRTLHERGRNHCKTPRLSLDDDAVSFQQQSERSPTLCD